MLLPSIVTTNDQHSRLNLVAAITCWTEQNKCKLRHENEASAAKNTSNDKHARPDSLRQSSQLSCNDLDLVTFGCSTQLTIVSPDLAK